MALQYQALLEDAELKVISWHNLERWLEDLIAKRALLEAFLEELKAIRSPEGEQVRKVVQTTWPPVPVLSRDAGKLFFASDSRVRHNARQDNVA